MLRKLVNLAWRVLLLGRRLPAPFDEDWYLGCYHDVARSGMDPLVHYKRFGLREGRDPNPWFSQSGFEYTQGFSSLPELTGAQQLYQDEKTWLFVGHRADKVLFGGERSYLDLLRVFSLKGVKCIAVLPAAVNAEYVTAVRRYCAKLYVLPYGWWRLGAKPAVETVEHFKRIIASNNVSVLYANTAVLNEPLVAAKELGVPSVVHVRELLNHDEALSDTLGANQEQLSEWVSRMGDLVVVNSEYTRKSSGLDEALVFPNPVDLSPFLKIAPVSSDREPLRVGLISSNLPKKGNLDVVDLAGKLSDLADRVEFWIVGPETQLVSTIRARIEKGELPANLKLKPYVERPEVILKELDVLLSLSHFEESFGRTVLEAMASGRAVIAYDHGAARDLVKHNETGYLVPPCDIRVLADCVRKLVFDRKLLFSMAEKARDEANRCAGRDSVVEAVESIIGRMAAMESRLLHYGERTL